MNSSPNAHCLAASLPPELLQMIFQIALDMEYYEPLYGTQQESRGFALVCHTWKRSAQAVMYKTCTMRTYRAWNHSREVIASSTELAYYVTSVKIDFTAWRRDGEGTWTAEELSDFLQLLPRLTTLSIHLAEKNGSPGYKADFSTLASLPDLHHISLSSDIFDKELTSYREILDSTPNITSLALEQYYSQVYAPPAKDDLTPVSLPSLVKLTLRGDQFVRLFNNLRLIGDTSMRNVKHLDVQSGPPPPYSLLKFTLRTLLNQIGGQLRKIEISQDKETGGMTTSEILKLCPQATTAIVRLGFRGELGMFPLSIRTLEISLYHDWSTLGEILEALDDLRNVDTLKILWRWRSKLVLDVEGKKACVAMGLRVIVDDEEIDLQDLEKIGEAGRY